MACTVWLSELRLDYAGLKRRVEHAGDTAPRGGIDLWFMKLFAPAAAGLREYVVELENARGAKMRVELSGKGLCSAF